MSQQEHSADEITVPVKRTDGETLEERMTDNAYHNILPARYLRKDADGNLAESQDDLFARVAENVALAEAVFESEQRDTEITVQPEQLKPNHPRRDELAADVFGAGTTADDDAETDLSIYNVNKFAYETVVPELPDNIRDHVESVADEFQESMERLSFMPNSPTLMNAGDELQQLSACFVDSPDDDLTDIHQTAKEAAEVFQCLTDETKVFVKDRGVVSIADVEPGDAIQQRDGDGYRTQHVEEIHAYDEAPTRTLRTEGGIELTGTPNHRLLVNDEWTEISDIDAGDTVTIRLDWIPDVDNTEELTAVETSRTVSNDAIATLHADGLTDYAIADFGSSSSTIQRHRVDELDVPANGEPVKSVTQPSQLTEDLAELLGFWIGDGSIHQDGIRFHVSREEVLEHIHQLSHQLFDIGMDWTLKEGCYEAVIHSHEVKRWWLENFGDAKRLVPNCIWQADHDRIHAFLRGLFTADGTLNSDKYPRLYSASEQLIDDAHQLLLGIGISSKKWTRDTDGREYFTVAPTGKRSLERYSTSIGFIDERTEEMATSLAGSETLPTKCGDIINEEIWEQEIVAVNDAGEQTVYDVTVSDNHEYIASSIVSHNSGGGMGYAFWQLRPYGDPVGSTGGIASGPITFMRTYDQLCETIAQGGTRRGAQMGVMRVSHPDVIEFIHSKNKDVSLAHTLRLNDPDDYTYTSFSEALEEARGLIDEEGRVPKHLRNAVEGHLSNFNISVGVTDGFMEALYEDEEFTFTNPRTGEPHVATAETKEMYARYDLGEYVEPGEELSLPAEIIWDRIVEGAHENGEPGVIYLERVNKEHSFDVDKNPDHRILATNPCGEQPLEEYEACNLGHINLSTIAAFDAPDWRVWSAEHADEHDSPEAAVETYLEEAIDFEEFDRRIELGTRFLEDVVTMSDFPVREIEEKVRELRKIGLGIMGLAQLYVQIGVRYGSDVGNEVARQLMTHINHRSKQTSHELALERGSFDDWEDSKYANPTEYREWFEHHTGESADDWEDGYPIRNHNSTTIAPTGTTSMVGNTTGGCEPIYNVAYYKNVSDDVQGDEMLVEFDDYFLRVLEANDIDPESVKAEAQEQMANNVFDGVSSLSTVPDAISELFVVTADITAREHAAVQCACQAGVDSAISKTVNAPNDSTMEDAKDVFEYIYNHGGKGVTYYRDGTRSKQVLTTRADNAEFADEREAAAAITEQIREVFGDIEDFLGSEEVKDALDEDIEELYRDRTGDAYARERPRPDVLYGMTQRVDTGYGKMYVNINEDENGEPFELFATIGNSGGFTASFTEGLAKTISYALRSGVDPREIAKDLQGIRSPKVAWDKGEQINSIPDAIGVAMRRYLDDEIDRPYPQQQHLTEITEIEEDPRSQSGSGTQSQSDSATDAGPNADVGPETDGGGSTADTQSLIDAGESPECPECGSMALYYSEGCKTCESCGWSEC
jgi:ribonucleoside-diphosphate reductase alpha chain